MTLGNSPGPDDTKAPRDSAGPSGLHDPAVAWLSGANMVTGCCLDPRYYVVFGRTTGHKRQLGPWLL